LELFEVGIVFEVIDQVIDFVFCSFSTVFEKDLSDVTKNNKSFFGLILEHAFMQPELMEYFFKTCFFG